MCIDVYNFHIIYTICMYMCTYIYLTFSSWNFFFILHCIEVLCFTIHFNESFMHILSQRHTHHQSACFLYQCYQRSLQLTTIHSHFLRKLSFVNRLFNSIAFWSLVAPGLFIVLHIEWSFCSCPFSSGWQLSMISSSIQVMQLLHDFIFLITA